MGRRVARASVWLVVTAVPGGAVAATPMSYLTGAGARAHPVTALTWGVLVVSIAVVVLVAIFVWLGIARRRLRGAPPIASVAPTRGGRGLLWLYWGVGLSSVVLIGALVWTVAVLAAINAPPGPAALTVEVTGQQWWWKVRYLDRDASRVLTTANEIHIPVGRPVRIRLIGADVIHSFWVPALGGKMDTIPGQTNTTWIEADRPGRYRGQCAEYCGPQHANMALLVVAEAPAAFDAWRDAQLEPAAAPASAAAARGAAVFAQRCGACHAVRGSAAAGNVAPDLTHLMSRGTIAAGALANTPANLSGWIANPQAIKPGTHMPTLYLSGPELADTRAYLATLR